MKSGRASIFVGAAAVAAAFAAWQLSGEAPRHADIPPAQDVDVPPVSVEWSGTRASSRPQQVEIAQRQPRNCTIVTHYLPNQDGTTTEARSCEPNEPQEEHPYASYPDDALESLAYADAKAAEILSMRLVGRDGEAAMSLALRAAALSGGDATPIVAYANAYPGPTAVNGVPVRRTVHVRYVLGTVTRLLGDSRHSVPYFEAIIREHSADPDREIAMLDKRAQQMIEEMRQIQLDVTGSSTIGG